MLIREHLARSGAGLFRWRSYVPLVVLPFIALSVAQGEQIEARFGALGDVVEVLAILLVVLGEGIRIATVGFVPRGTSGRNTTGQIADTLNVTGLYSLTRNPLYLGNCLMYVGVALYTQSVVLTATLSLALAIYYERIIAAEEDFLSARFGRTYLDWAAVTPAFFPRLRPWVAPALGFSWRSVVRREHASVYGAVVMLFLVEVGLHAIGTSDEAFEPVWFWVLGMATVMEVAALWAKKRSHILRETGR